MSDISNTDDIIDSRDVIARIEELDGEREALSNSVTDAETADDMQTARSALDEWDNSHAEELAALKALADEAEGYASDWHHGETLIRDSYFKEYAMQIADDIGAIPRDAGWPCTCIDWDQAARELQMDYTSVDFDGVTYWIR